MTFEDANVKAFEGGDTEPETAKIIHQRNQALEEHKDKLVAAGQKMEEARQDMLDAHDEAEAQAWEEGEPDLTGAPVVTSDVENAPRKQAPGAAQPGGKQAREGQTNAPPSEQTRAVPPAKK